jgi:exosome complex exonuclease RRP6
MKHHSNNKKKQTSANGNTNSNQSNKPNRTSNKQTPQQLQVAAGIVKPQRTKKELSPKHSKTITVQDQPTNSTSESSQSTNKAIIADQNLDDYIQNLFSQLVQGTRVSNNLPTPSEFAVLKVTQKGFSGLMSKYANRLKSTISQFIASSGLENPATSDDVGDLFDSTVDLLDSYFESVDIAFDEMEAPLKDKKIVQARLEETNLVNNKIKNLLRPQLQWDDVDNDNKPFVPKIKKKYNANVASLEQSMNLKWTEEEQRLTPTSVEQFPFRFSAGMGVGGPTTRESAPHPYEPELLSLEYTDEQLSKPKTITMYKGLDATPCTWVHTKEDLQQLADVLDTQQEFAIDLEQHSYRTFQGFVCLMQISTLAQDYLIDTIQLRKELYILNSSFTNPKIVKIMHGADCDILWLQRDFGIYVVNLFDTGQASRVLGFPGFSLGYLLKHYCSVDVDKKYQLADWRVRPLPSEMVKYARQDTHYLVYIYNRMRQDLYDRANGPEKIHDVLQRSMEICLRRYEKELFTETAFYSVIRNAPHLDNTQQMIVRALYKWRDSVARAEDESVRYVMPNHMMIAVAEGKPKTPQELMLLCNPVPKIVRNQCQLILQIVQDATNQKIDELLNRPPKVDDYVPPSPVGPPTSTLSQSPVLNTDQLYQTAGWTGQPPLISRLNFSDEELSSSSDEEDDDMTESTPIRTSSRRISLSEKSAPSLFSFASVNDVMDMDEERRSRVNQIWNSFSSVEVINGHHVQPQSVEQLEFKTPKPFTKETIRSTPPEERVPNSLNEIYKLSQKNRKRNKQKKKLKQDSVTDPSPAYSPDSVTSSRVQQIEEEVEDEDFLTDRDKESNNAKPADFMRQIGWLSDTEQIEEQPVEEQVQPQEYVDPYFTIQQPGNGGRRGYKAFNNKR